jgi:hypothetical protein
MLSIILLVFALVLFIIAGAWNTDPWRSRLVSFGLACWVGAELLRGAVGVLK